MHAAFIKNMLIDNRLNAEGSKTILSHELNVIECNLIPSRKCTLNMQLNNNFQPFVPLMPHVSFVHRVCCNGNRRRLGDFVGAG
jgi:hypothetical protein